MPDPEIDRDLAYQILNSLGQGVAASRIVDGRWIIEYANPALASMLGDQLSEIVGRSFEEFLHPDDIPRLLESRAKRIEGITTSYEVRISRKDGSVLPVLITGVPRVVDNQIVGGILVITDLSDYYSVLRRLKSSERRLLDILEFMPDPAFGIDMEGRVIFWNRALEDLTGVKKDQMLGKGNYECAIPFYGRRRPVLAHLAIGGYDESLPEGYRNLRREGDVLTAEVFIPTFGRGGAHLWLKAAPIYSAEGTVEGAIEVIRDITENVKRVDELRLSEARYRSIVEDMPFLVCRFDHDGVLTFVNENYCRYFGLERSEILGRSFLELIPEDDREAVLRRFRSLTPERPHVTYIHRVKRGDEIRWQRWTDRAIFGQDGAVLEYQSLGEDITAEKNMEDALRESEHKFRVLAERTAACITIFKDERFLYINHSGERICGYTRDELLGESIWKVVHPEDAIWLREMYSRMVRGEPTPSRYEFRIVTKSGEVRWVDYASGIIQFEGEPAIIGTSIDITERRQAEEELRRLKASLEDMVRARTEELEKRNEEMESFVYTVSHDLRRPLITISGLAGLAELDLDKGDVEKARESLRKIARSAESMDMLLSDILELSRIGRLVNPPEDVPFELLVKDAIDQLSEMIRSRGAEIKVADGMPTVRVDRMRVVEALVNLIDNSIKYTGKDKRPVIEIFYRDGVFCIRDNGIGIPEKQRVKVFELFYKVDPKSDGTGVGLTIVKRIIEFHGGRIWVESDGCSWTAFCFTLPVVS
ncbi:MAG: PAS domain S-box protein [Methanothrix sp.]|uniref:PAS domain S-box protein n=1 Tax=Methanothrix sp. TaxID=90426 RepID=UPI0025F159C1|nr:PAS domain S-box protein [Methanothrix sp.]MCQ8903585.1 PAS domain S-box protein [Methanothrix sp.]